jgi:hypothetical protein
MQEREGEIDAAEPGQVGAGVQIRVQNVDGLPVSGDRRGRHARHVGRQVAGGREGAPVDGGGRGGGLPARPGNHESVALRHVGDQVRAGGDHRVAVRVGEHAVGGERRSPALRGGRRCRRTARARRTSCHGGRRSASAGGGGTTGRRGQGISRRRCVTAPGRTQNGGYRVHTAFREMRAMAARVDRAASPASRSGARAGTCHVRATHARSRTARPPGGARRPHARRPGTRPTPMTTGSSAAILNRTASAGAASLNPARTCVATQVAPRMPGTSRAARWAARTGTATLWFIGTVTSPAGA